MSSALDMSLDDIIKSNKKTSGSGNSRNRGRGGASGGGGGGSGPGPTRRFHNRGVNRSSPYTAAKAPESSWQHDMYSDQVSSFPAAGHGGRASAIETGTKLLISNLEYGVSAEDIKELFSEVGDLKQHTIHYDRSGRSKGTAEVVYARHADAIAAIKRYHNVQLDGKPMKIEIVGVNISTPAPPTTAVAGFGNAPGLPRGGQGRGGALGRLRGSSSRGRGGRGRGQGGKRDEKLSAKDLDADLEKYHSESMQIAD